MTKRKYSFEPLTDDELTALAEKYPEAVETYTVTIRRPVYRVIAMLLQCKLDVPGIRLKERSGDDIETDRRNDGTPAETVPDFLDHKKRKA
jgi:hypothetical protein